jgi:hypothetical protein
MTQQIIKTFYAVMHVTRTAETAEEARELLLSGAGYRYGAGERVHIEVEQITENEK